MSSQFKIRKNKNKNGNKYLEKLQKIKEVENNEIENEEDEEEDEKRILILDDSSEKILSNICDCPMCKFHYKKTLEISGQLIKNINRIFLKHILNTDLKQSLYEVLRFYDNFILSSNKVLSYKDITSKKINFLPTMTEKDFLYHFNKCPHPDIRCYITLYRLHLIEDEIYTNELHTQILSKYPDGKTFERKEISFEALKKYRMIIAMKKQAIYLVNRKIKKKKINVKK